MPNFIKSILFFVLCLLLLACNTSQSQSLSGRILLWHSWNDQETEILRTILAKYSEINPDVRVISARIPPSQLRRRYQNTAGQGLGPDLLIGSSEWVRSFADAGLIKRINCDLQDDQAAETSLCIADTSRYLPNALSTLRYQENLYGVPLSLQPEALYYNKNLVSSPASTLDDLLAQASAGKRVAFNTSFDAAFWGIQAFGGKLFDEEGRVILDQGGFANWLGWLKNAQSTPGMILSRDDVTLRNLFVNEEAAYYIGTPDVLLSLTDVLGEETVGVVPLPTGPTAAAGPLLDVDAIMFNHASSSNQTKLALDLATFLTNAEQNMILMREANRVPANQRVRVDMQAYPVMAAFASGARTAVSTPNLAQMDRIRQLGNDAYNQLLEGVIDITKVVYELTNTVNPEYGFEQVEVPEATCQQSGRLQLWHSWQGEEASQLERIKKEFEANCPGVIVDLTDYATELDLSNAISETMTSLRPPHLIIGPATWVTTLSEKELIAPITTRIDAKIQQRYRPLTVDALRIQETLYGLPISLDINALYYKKEEVNAPATLDELLAQSSAEQQVAMPTNFYDAFWGISAFGGPSTLFDEQSRFTLGVGEGGLVAWLSWLKTAQESPSIVLNNNPRALELLFTKDERVDYYIGPTSALSRTLAALGTEQVGVAPLPSGPIGSSQPLLNVDAFFFGVTSRDAPTDLAITFAAAATNASNQKLLLEQTFRVPANVNATLEPEPTEEQSDAPQQEAQLSQIAGFLTQVQSAFIIPKVPQMGALRQLGDTVYDAVLVEGQDPIVAGCLFNIAVNEKNGFAREELKLPPDCPPPPPTLVPEEQPEAESTPEEGAVPEEVPTEVVPINNTP